MKTKLHVTTIRVSNQLHHFGFPTFVRKNFFTPESFNRKMKSIVIKKFIMNSQIIKKIVFVIWTPSIAVTIIKSNEKINSAM